MKLKITGRHVTVTDRMREFAESKVSRVEKYFHQIIDIQIVYWQEKLDTFVEIIINADGARFYASEKGGDFFSAFDVLLDVLDNQVKKHKEKLQDHKSKTGLNQLPVIDMNREKLVEVDVEEAFIKPVDYKEAYLEMKMDSKDYFFFTKAASIEKESQVRCYSALFNKGGQMYMVDEEITGGDQKKSVSLFKVAVNEASPTDPVLTFHKSGDSVAMFTLNEALAQGGEGVSPFFNIETSCINLLVNSKRQRLVVPA